MKVTLSMSGLGILEASPLGLPREIDFTCEKDNLGDEVESLCDAVGERVGAGLAVAKAQRLNLYIEIEVRR